MVNEGSPTAMADARCADLARDLAVDPIGTAAHVRGLLALPCPLPWPRDPNEVLVQAGMADRVAALGLRVQLTVPTPECVMSIYWRPDDRPFRGFLKLSERWDLSSSVAALARLLERMSSDGTVEAHRRHVLICTHGRRDRCCGSAGTRLWADCDETLAQSSAEPTRILLDRTSHLGGHRFAPTAVVMPEGTVWAFLDPSVLQSVLHRDVPFAAVESHYRGCMGLEGPEVQVLERHVLRDVGWELLDRPRAGRVGAGGHVALDVEGPGGITTWSGLAVARAFTAAASCGASPEPMVEWSVAAVERHPSSSATW